MELIVFQVNICFHFVLIATVFFFNNQVFPLRFFLIATGFRRSLLVFSIPAASLPLQNLPRLQNKIEI